MAQTGLGCHGNRDRSKGQNLESKPGQSETVTEATAGAKRELTKGQGAQIPSECLSAALTAFGSAQCIGELSGPGVP